MTIWRFLALAAALVTPARAQQPSPNLAGIAHVALRVHDLQVSVAFYEKLGYVKAFELSRDGAVYEAFIKIDDRQFIELYPTDAKNAQPGFLHVCFEGNDLQAVHDYYVAHGLAPTNVRTAGAGNLLFTMPGPATPTGPQNLEYTQYQPSSMHTKDFGRNLGPGRVSKHLLTTTIAVKDPAAAVIFYLDKLGFLPTVVPDHLAIPGSHAERIDLAPATAQGMKAVLTFESSDARKTYADLKKRGLAVTGARGRQRLDDPDGNQIDFKPDTTLRDR